MIKLKSYSIQYVKQDSLSFLLDRQNLPDERESLAYSVYWQFPLYSKAL